MSTETGEVIDVFTKTGTLMYKLMGPIMAGGVGVGLGVSAAVGKGVLRLTKGVVSLIGKLIKWMHKKYMLNGRASVNSLLWNVGGDASKLAVYTIPKEHQDKFMQAAREMHVPYAMVPSLSDNTVSIAIRASDAPLMQPLINDMGGHIASHEEAVHTVTSREDAAFDQIPMSSMSLYVTRGDLNALQSETQRRDVWTATPQELGMSQEDIREAMAGQDDIDYHDGDNLVLVRDDQMDAFRDAARASGSEIVGGFQVLEADEPPRTSFRDANRMNKSLNERGGSEIEVHNLDQLQPDSDRDRIRNMLASPAYKSAYDSAMRMPGATPEAAHQAAAKQYAAKTGLTQDDLERMVPDTLDTRFAVMVIDLEKKHEDPINAYHALEKACENWNISAELLDQPGDKLMLRSDGKTVPSEGQLLIMCDAADTGGLLKAAKEAGFEADIAPATRDQVKAAEDRIGKSLPESLEAKREQAGDRTERSDGAVISDPKPYNTLARAGTKQVLESNSLGLFIHTAAANPEHSASNILAEMAQNTNVDRLIKPEEAIRKGYTIQAHADPVDVCTARGTDSKDKKEFEMRPFIEMKDTVPAAGKIPMERQEPLPPEQILAALGKASGFSRNGTEPADGHSLPVREEAANVVADAVFEAYRENRPGQALKEPADLSEQQKEVYGVAARIACQHYGLPDPPKLGGRNLANTPLILQHLSKKDKTQLAPLTAAMNAVKKAVNMIDRGPYPPQTHDKNISQAKKPVMTGPER